MTNTRLTNGVDMGTPGHNPPRRLDRSRPVLILISIASVLGWGAVLWIDPFGIETASDRASIALFQRFQSPFYSDASQNRIFVVTIQDADLPLSEGGTAYWPMPYEDYDVLVRGLAGDGRFGPAAIMLDILFENVPRDTARTDILCQLAEDMEAVDVPLIFARLPDFEEDTIPMPRALQDCPDGSLRTAAIGWRLDEGLYPLTVALNGETLDSAATALYRITLDRIGGRARTARLTEFEGALSADRPFRTQWGATAPPGSGDECRDFSGTFWEKARKAARIVADGVLPDQVRRRDFEYVQPCLFHLSLNPRDIVRMTEEQKLDLAAYLDGSIVLIGPDVAGIPDFVDSPVHGLVPGVYWHAMSLDNLMTQHAGLLRDPPKVDIPFFRGSLPVGADILIQAGLLLALALTLHLLPRPFERAGKRGSRRVGLMLFNLAVFLIFAAVTCAIVLLTFAVMRWAPINYGALIMVGAAMIFLKSYKQTEA